MEYKALINILPHEVLLDPQGKAVMEGLKNLGIQNVDSVRVGKRITMNITADSKQKAEEATQKACEELLANKIMEYFEFEVVELQKA